MRGPVREVYMTGPTRPLFNRYTPARKNDHHHVLSPKPLPHVGSPRGITVRSMLIDEAATLLVIARNKPSASKEVGLGALLQELRYLPLAISQAGG